jgi:ribosomal protein RSM22 (predicted rRNA methylase)
MDDTRPLHRRMLVLPDDLQEAIGAALGTVSRVRWMREAQALSERYRGPRDTSQKPFASSPAEVLGYAAMILPASYAQLRGAMAATAARIPDWTPRTLLDLGSGPGTAMWAAVAQWTSLGTLVAWERERAFMALGQQLARHSSSEAIRAARWEQVDLRHAQTREQTYDLVVLGHVLNELGEAEQAAVVERAWAMTAGVLLIVEPGTAAAFPVVRAARDLLLTAAAHTLAPCAHDQPCPLQNDWCHFPQRLKRTPFQRRAREAPSEWEDSKYSYAAMARFPVTHPIWGRVIREPTSNKAYAEALISSRQGVAIHRALKRHKADFRAIRELRWGDALDEPPAGEQVSR